MDTFDLFVTGLLLALLIILFPMAGTGWYSRYAVGSFSRRIGLALPEELAETVRRRVIRRSRAACVGAFVATVGAAALLFAGIIDPGRSASALWFILGAYFTGMAVAAAITAITDRPSSDDSRPRVARSGAVDVSDYVAPFERLGARAIVGASTLVLVASIVVSLRDGGRPNLTAGIAIVVLGIASLVFFELVARRIIARSQPAGSTAGLAFDDGLRSTALRDIVTAPIVLGTWGLLFVGSDLLTHPSIPDVILPIVSILLMLVAAGLVFLVTARRPAQHFLRQLRPEVETAARAQYATAQANTPTNGR